MSDGIATTVGDARRVLVVGDSPRMESTADALASGLDPVSVLRTRTVAEADRRLAGEEIHCVLCEFRPDERSPLEVLVESGTDIPVIAVTDDETAARALEVGATDVLTTGTSAAVLAARVGNAVDCYRLADRTDDRHRALVESVDVPVWLLESDGTVAYANPAVESRLGYTSGELEKMPLERLVHPDDRSTLREVLATVGARSFGATEETTIRIGDADGRWRVVELRCVNRLAEPSLEGVVVTAFAPAAATDQQGGLDRLEWPLFAVGTDWELQWSNRAADRLFVDASEPGAVVWGLLPEPVRETFREHLREARASGAAVRFETSEVDTDGPAVPLVVTAHPDGDGITVIGRERDADRRAPGQARRDLLEATVDALEDGVAVVDEGTIDFVDASLTRMAGTNALVGSDVDDLFDDDLAATIRERARSSVVRWLEPVQGTLSGADEAIDVDVYVSPLRNDERTLCLVRDRRRSAAGALSTVRRTAATLRSADAASTVRRAVTDAVQERTDADLAVWYLFDDDLLCPAAVATPEDHPGLEPPPVERDDRRLPLEDGIGVADGSAIEPFLTRAGITAERVLTVSVGEEGFVLATSTDPMAFQSLERDRDREALAAIGDATSVSLDRFAGRKRVRHCRRERARLENELATAETARVIERRLLEAESREGVERELCEGIVSLGDDIELAWIGRTDPGRGTVVPKTWAGQDSDVVEGLSITVDPDVEEPTGRTAARRTSTRVDDLKRAVADDMIAGQQLLETGVRSVLSVPLERDGGRFQYGVLTAYADRPSAFDEGRQDICEHLATVATHVIDALERKRALLSDSVVELEVVLRDESEPLAAFARELGTQIEVRAAVPRSSDGSTLYCTLAGGTDDPRPLVDSVTGLESIQATGDVDGSPVELEFSEATVAETVAAHGGVVRSVRPVDDRVRLVIDLSSIVDVRPFLEALERAHAEIDLVARRERDRTPRFAQPFDAELRKRLSERQLRTLESAYYGGFFEWPRESTGEEVADSLGVSQPTFSRHLRLAQGKLFELLFEDRAVGLD
ncbi:bacterio-opsin activator domain-containing protein [Natronobacterium gregoryi]|uniref:PAS domain S-box n=2 Tax=Natronobacterium gregoryi TaxID=44930 RepID=L0AKN2_NATGS|nr:bacterio-opsin activator domain-containing protein [Natronobacterium gregoryi]AFZ74463.1 PAS domain S-box [Natronobacterium gregoryi SP2]ELY72239.1 PAS/PAC sensor protein [Natronobacterium gregoryi SP2]PLK21789.1 PAS domain S-box protein [Natronobacterium gregoryi SP2]SFJ46145.1 PAS domain S-box-containing protein [Natronobacterium gregoryi]